MERGILSKLRSREFDGVATLGELGAIDEIECLKAALYGILEVVEAIQRFHPEFFIPSLHYNQRVMTAKDALRESAESCPECGGCGYDPNPLNDPGPCNICSGLGEVRG